MSKVLSIASGKGGVGKTLLLRKFYTNISRMWAQINYV